MRRVFQFSIWLAALALLALSAPARAVETPVLWYDFEDMSGLGPGATVNNRGSLGDGTVSGNVFSVGGSAPNATTPGNAGSFPDGNHFIQTNLSSNSLGMNQSSYTAAAWLFPQQFGGGENNDNIVFGQESGSVLHLGTRNSGGDVQFGHWGGGNDSSNGTDLALNTWTHVAWRYNATLNEGAIFINGNQVSSNTQGPLNNAGNVIIGTTRPDQNRDFVGGLDDVLIYDSALSASSIAALAAGGDPNQAENFLADAVSIPAAAAQQDAIGGKDPGLRGEWWKRGTGNSLATAESLADQFAPDATFVSSAVDYVQTTGDSAPSDTTITDFLGNDAITLDFSMQPTDNGTQDGTTSSNDSFWRFSGFIEIDESYDLDPDTPGILMQFAIPSDDASNLVIGGVEVLNNDGGHGFPGAGAGPALVNFDMPGLYSIEGLLTQGGGGFGIEWKWDGNGVPGIDTGGPTALNLTPDSNVLFQNQQFLPEPATGLLGLLGVAALGFRRRRMAA